MQKKLQNREVDISIAALPDRKPEELEFIEILETSPKLKPFTVAACTILKNKDNPIVQSFWNIVEKEMINRSEQL